jgi:hypothetical protein
MNAARWIYRTRQFWQALELRNLGLSRKKDLTDLEQARTVLSAPLFILFTRLQPSEQAHSLRVLQALQVEGENQPDLLAAALLHDVGKIRMPLRLWERVLIVLVHPAEQTNQSGWRRSFARFIKSLKITNKALLVAENHAAWGAELAVSAGASPLTISLIRRHQEIIPPTTGSITLEDQLLRKLQTGDDEN